MPAVPVEMETLFNAPRDGDAMVHTNDITDFEDNDADESREDHEE